MQRNILKAIVVTSFFLLVFASSVSAKQLRMLSAWNENFIFVTGAGVQLMDNINEVSGGELNVKFNGPDVIPTFEQLQPLQAGVFDINYTHYSYHAGTIGVGLGIDATDVDPVQRRESGIFDFLDKEYNKIGVKIISLPPIATYQFITKQPLNGSNPSFDGLKFRSNPAIQETIQSLGGAPVTMSGGEVYTSLQKGVIDGAVWTTVGVKDFKWNEVADYLVRPTFGYITLMFAMNLDKYNSLTAEERGWIDEAGKKTELDSLAYYKNLGEIEIAELKKAGMKETWLHAEDAKNIESYWNNGLWKMAIAKSGEPAKKFKALAVAKGLTR